MIDDAVGLDVDADEQMTERSNSPGSKICVTSVTGDKDKSAAARGTTEDPNLEEGAMIWPKSFFVTTA